MKKYQVEMTKNEAEVDGSGSRNFGYDCENLAKIWLRLRKFRNHRENFAILEKFSLCEIFAKLAKFR